MSSAAPGRQEASVEALLGWLLLLRYTTAVAMHTSNIEMFTLLLANESVFPTEDDAAFDDVTPFSSEMKPSIWDINHLVGLADYVKLLAEVDSRVMPNSLRRSSMRDFGNKHLTS
jgi:hypothetical protein